MERNERGFSPAAGPHQILYFGVLQKYRGGKAIAVGERERKWGLRHCFDFSFIQLRLLFLFYLKSTW